MEPKKTDQREGEEPALELLQINFDTEIVSLFWGFFGSGRSLENGNISTYSGQFVSIVKDIGNRSSTIQPTNLLKLFNNFNETDSVIKLSSYLQYSVITVGILTIVSASTYFTYRAFKAFRFKTRTKIPNNSYNNVTQEETKVESGVTNSKKSTQLIPRPSSLSLFSSTIGDTGGGFVGESNKRIVSRVFSGDDTGDDVDEFEDDLEGVYFGPEMEKEVHGENPGLNEDRLYVEHVERLSQSISDSAYTSDLANLR